MQKSHIQELQDTLNTQSNAEETHKQESGKITEREQIDETPFWLLKVNEKWFIALGDSRITELYDTKEEAAERLNKDNWKIIMQLIVIFLEKFTVHSNINMKPSNEMGWPNDNGQYD